MTEKTEVIKLDLSVDEGYRGDVVTVTPERAKQLFAAKAARPAPAKYERNALEDKFHQPTPPNPVINSGQALFGSTPPVTDGPDATGTDDEDGTDDDSGADSDD